MNGQRMPVSEQEVDAMRERLRKRQEERRRIVDIDAVLDIANRPRKEAVGILVPIEEAREFCEFRKAGNLRGNWMETAVMAAVSALTLLVSFLTMVR